VLTVRRVATDTGFSLVRPKREDAAPPARRRRPAAMASRYDAAGESHTDRDHWRYATDETAYDENSPWVRAKLRRRSVYECKNNGYLNGLVKTLAHDLVGTGPRVQLTVDERTRDAARVVERAFAKWSRAAGYADKLRVMEESRVRKGECFGQLFQNPLARDPVQLSLALVGTERVTTPAFLVPGVYTDGIVFDQYQNPVEYHVLKGGALATMPGVRVTFGDIDRVPARFMTHWFRADEPGQFRGAPETSPTLLVGAQLRRYGTATLTAAEVHASFTGVMETDVPADDGDDPGPRFDTMDEVPTHPGMLLTLPPNWKAKPFDVKQPVTNYGEFVREKLAEVGRPHLAPRNVAIGDSSDSNFSSNRSDRQPYYRMHWINRERLRHAVLDPVFTAWAAEYELAVGLPTGLPPVAEWDWDWHWDGFDAIDPVKDATAADIRINQNTTTLMEECARDGKDFEDVLRQRAKELATVKALEAEYGVTFPVAGAKPLPPAATAADPKPAPAGGTNAT
jgi:lambda family phage portal protein